MRYRASLVLGEDTDFDHFTDQIAAFMTTAEYMDCEWSYDLRRLRFMTVRGPLEVLAEWSEGGYPSSSFKSIEFVRMP